MTRANRPEDRTAQLVNALQQIQSLHDNPQAYAPPGAPPPQTYTEADYSEIFHEAGRELRFAARPSPTERRFRELIDESKQILSTDVERAVAAAREALDIAPQQHPELHADAELEALTTLANAYRRSGDFRTAEPLAERAGTLVDEERLVDPALEGHFYLLRGKLAGAHDEHGEGLFWYDTAIEHFEEIHDRHQAGVARSFKAMALRRLHRTEEGVDELLIALGEIDRSRDGLPFFATLQSLVLGYLELGEPRAASVALEKARLAAEGIAQPTDLLRFDWAEARICHLQERPELAEAKLRAVAAGFRELGLFHDAAFAHLEIAGWLIAAGRVGEVQVLARESYAVFAAAGVPQKALAAYALLQAADSVAAVERAAVAIKALQQKAWAPARTPEPG